MGLKNYLYRLIYSPRINFILRNVCFACKNFISAKLLIPPSGKIKIRDESFGEISIKTNQTSYLTYLLYYFGLKNFEYTTTFLSLIMKVKTFVDIGANIGYYSILAGKMNEKIKIYSFEPAKGPFHYLKENIKINSLSDVVKTERFAISNSEGEIEFNEITSLKYDFIKYNLSGEHSIDGNSKNVSYSKNKILTTTIDSYFKNKQVDLIKIDVEGSEINALKGGIGLIKKYKPLIICETLFKMKEQELESFVKNIDFLIYKFIGGQLKKSDTLIRTVDDGVRNCLFLHKSKLHLINEYII